MKRSILTVLLVLLLIGTAYSLTYSENFDTDSNWAGGTMTGYNAKTYINNATAPEADGFSSNSSVRETTNVHSAGYAWRIDTGTGPFYFRYESSVNVNSFSMYLARWDNSPVPSFTIRYSVNSGTSYTDIETLTGSWFTGDLTYKQYVYNFATPISPNAGQKIYIEVYKTAGERLLIDDFSLSYTVPSTPMINVSTTSLTGFLYAVGSGPSSEQSFTVSGANLTNDISVSPSEEYEISTSTGVGFVATNPIVLNQSGGSVAATTIYVRMESGLLAGTHNGSVTATSDVAADKTVTCNGNVMSPSTTTLPYSETFTTSLGETYSYSVSGTKPWNLSNETATANGFQSALEEQWLVLPGINFNAQTSERMTFTSSAAYGTIDANNYLKLFYSTNYPGLGNPTTSTWTEISCALASIGASNVSSGVLDLSTISGTQVYLAFKYYSTNNPTRWSVDNINIYVATPLITVSPATLTGFSYEYLTGPSVEQYFTVSGADLQSGISIDAPTNYEISTGTGTAFVATDPISLSQAKGSIPETTIYVRLKAGLAIGVYSTEVITASSTFATDKTVTCSGSVTTPPAPDAPVATAATGIGSDSFTANWGTVSGATGYYLDVYTKTSSSSAADLFISEYIEGSSSNKAIEIYNGTGSTVTLTGYNLKVYANGSITPGSAINLSGTVDNGSVYIVANPSANAAILALDNMTSGSLTHNGNDAVGLFNGTNLVDVVGTIGDANNWGIDVTLVRKSAVTAPNAVYSSTDWDSYPVDTFTYLGSHTFTGGSTLSYVSGYQNKDVSNVLTYSITGLDPSTTYYYVVRAYNTYGTSANSNEITVLTSAAPADIVVNADGSATGASIVPGGTIPSSLLGADSGVPAVIYTITATGTHDVTVYKTATFQGDWYCWINTPGGLLAGTNPIPAATAFYTFTNVNFDAKGDVVVILNDNQTLPVELSSFTAVISSQNFVNLMWTTQSETGVSGFYIYRGTIEDASQAELISPMIMATNTSVTHTYLYTDNQLYNDGVYYYWLQNVDFDGTNSFHGPVVVNYSTETGGPGTPVIPEVTELKGIFPNPFNPTAQISYSLKDAASVSIKVYNSRGQIVRSFDNAPGTVGNHRIVWDGRDFNGSGCSTGVYFVRMFAGKEVFTQKAVLVK